MRTLIAACFCALIVAACQAEPNAQHDFYAHIDSKDCYQLAVEKAYQRRIADGITERLEKQVVPDDVGAAALTLGYSVVSNTVERRNRDLRLDDAEARVARIERVQREKGCIE